MTVVWMAMLASVFALPSSGVLDLVTVVSVAAAMPVASVGMAVAVAVLVVAAGASAVLPLGFAALLAVVFSAGLAESV